jgi:uncharacterized repeat protein (TIGR01451 family)
MFLIVKGGEKVQKNIQKRVLMLTLAVLFALVFCGSVSAEPTTTTLTFSENPTYVGHAVTLTAHVNNSTGAMVGRTVRFAISGVGTYDRTTNSNGDATYTYTPSSDTDRTITATHLQSGGHAQSSDTKTLNVAEVRDTDTELTLSHNSAVQGNNIALKAHLTRDTPGPGAWPAYAGQTIIFSVHGTDIGSNTTDSNGNAYWTYTASTENYFNVRARFAGAYEGTSYYYESSSDTDDLFVFGTSTSLSFSPSTITVGDPVTLRSRLTRGGNALNGQTIHFFVNGVEVGTGTTGWYNMQNGWASFTYTPTSSGIKNVYAAFYGYLDSLGYVYYQGSSSAAQTLTVNPISTRLTVTSVSGHTGDTKEIKATLTTAAGVPLGGRTVSFTVNGDSAGTAVTDTNGVATLSYPINNMCAGEYPIVATFAQDEPYAGVTNSSTLTVLPTANVIITKAGNGPLNVGQTGTFTITLHNNGLDTAHNVVVTDVLPGGFSFGTPSQGSISGNVWNVGMLACGDSATVTVSGLITSDMAGTTINNQATETQDEFTQESQSACANIVVNPMANVAITKAGNGPLNVGQTGTFTITLHNNGLDTAHNVVVTDVLPGGFSFGTPSQGSISGNVWNVGMLACGDSATVTVSGLITSDMAGTTINNQATETQDEFTQESQSACANIYVPSADLVLTKTVDKTKPVVKDIVIFTLIVNNHGPDTSVGVQVADKLPQGLTFVKYAASTGTYDPATGIWTIGDLKNGETAWINITSTVDQVGNITNNASVTSMTYDPNIEGSSSSASLDAQQPQSGGGVVTPDNGSSNYSSVGAETVAMQKTGVPIGMILTALLMLVTGLIMPRKK